MSHLDDAELWALLAEELPAERAAPVQAHLAACAPCRDQLAGLRVARAAAGTLGSGEPSPFASARMTRALSATLDREVHVQRHAWRPSRVAAAIAFATVSGAAVAMTASGAWRERPPATAEVRARPAPKSAAIAATELAEQPAAALDTERLDAEPVDAEPLDAEPREIAPREREPRETRLRRTLVEPAHDGALPAPAKRPAPRLARVERRARLTPPETPASGRAPRARALDGPRVSLAPGTPTPRQAADRARAALEGRPGAVGWRSVGDLYAQAGAPQEAAHAYIQALRGPEGEAASERLRVLARDPAFEASLLDVLAASPEAHESAEGARLRCEWGLKVRADREAVSWCQAFGRAFPAHPAVHGLALAAGQVAETRLADLPLAVAEYSRALVVSEFADLPSSEALLYRARALSRLGNDAEAQADLRLYLHVDPTAARRPDVAALARSLDVPLPR